MLLPRENEADLDDLSPEVRNQLTFTCVDTLDQVFEIALESKEDSHPNASAPNVTIHH